MPASNPANLELLRASIRSVPDFPHAGILFRDITPLFSTPATLNAALEELAVLAPADYAYIAGIEARGFMLGVPLAQILGKGFIPIRKPGKLPAQNYGIDYGLEYGQSRLEIHVDACKQGDKVWLVDDLLATGGSMAAGANLVEQVGGEVVAASVLIELDGLNGWATMEKYPCSSVISLPAG